MSTCGVCGVFIMQHCMSLYLSSSKLFCYDNMWAIKNWLSYFDQQVVWARENFFWIHALIQVGCQDFWLSNVSFFYVTTAARNYCYNLQGSKTNNERELKCVVLKGSYLLYRRLSNFQGRMFITFVLYFHFFFPVLNILFCVCDFFMLSFVCILSMPF